MKTLYLLSALILMATITNAQFKNTKWEGTLAVPYDTKVIFDFKTDTVAMIIAENAMVGERMTYSVKDDIITMVKIDGNSPCEVGGAFKVKFVLNNDKLFISNFSDPCDPRIQSWNTRPLVRVK